jgi:phosphatidylglycerol---prolipoprotein diacylglyceryl transferase
MLPYPSIDPIIVTIGPISLRWYGMMYLLGFIAAYFLGRHRSKQVWSPLHADQVEDLVFYGAVGAVLGGRIGYVFFYGFDHFLTDPLWLFRIWEGGMAFHGGLLGVIFALFLYGRKLGQPLGAICDFVAPIAPIGLGLGRLANFINGELYGRATDVPWAMVFPSDPEGLARHPSQLYQCLLEGLVVFAIVYGFSRRRRPLWAVSGVFLLAYGAARFAVEFVREPDASLLLDWMTRGQLLSLPMIIIGAAMLIFSYTQFRRQGGVYPTVETRPKQQAGAKASAKNKSKGSKRSKKTKASQNSQKNR